MKGLQWYVNHVRLETISVVQSQRAGMNINSEFNCFLISPSRDSPGDTITKQEHSAALLGTS